MTGRSARLQRVIAALKTREPDGQRVSRIVENFPKPLDSTQRILLWERVNDALAYHYFLTQPSGRPTAKQLGEHATTISTLCNKLLDAIIGEGGEDDSPIFEALAKAAQQEAWKQGRAYKVSFDFAEPNGASLYNSCRYLWETLERVEHLTRLAKKVEAKGRQEYGTKKSRPPYTLEQLCVGIFAEITGETPKVDQDFRTGECRGAVCLFIRLVDPTIPDSAIKRAVTAFNKRTSF
jgi:hypothetical protein